MRSAIKVITLLGAFLFSFASQSTDLADLGQTSPIKPIYILKDPLKTHNSTSIQNTPSHLWTKQHKDHISLGYTQSHIWLRFTLSNTHNQAIRAFLTLNFPLLDEVAIYKVKDKQLQLALQTGDHQPYHDRIIKHPWFILPITQVAGQTSTYYVKLKSTAPIHTQPQLWEPKAFYNQARITAAIDFFYYGLLGSTAFFNLFIFLFTRRSIFFHYSAYTASVLLFIAAQQGALFEFLLYDLPIIHGWAQIAFAALMTTFVIIFSRHFLQLDQSKPLGKLLYKLAFIPLPLMLFSSFSGEALAVQTTLLCAVITTTLCYGIAIYEVRKQQLNAKVFVFAWSFLYVGGITYTLAKLGVLPFTAVTANALQIGSAFELLIFTIALAYNMHSEREARLNAKKQILEKTQANSQLKSALIYTNTHDKISGLPNRALMEGWLDNYLRQHPDKPCTLVFVFFSRLHEIGRTLGENTAQQALVTFSNEANTLAASLNHITPIQPEKAFHIGSLEGATHLLLLSAPTTDKLISEVSALQRALNKPFRIQQITIEPGVQVALVESPKHGKQASKLIRHGSIALDAARENKQQLSHYSPDIDPYSERRLSLMSELRKALQSNELVLHYQPIINTETQSICGAEALIRWPHPAHGLILPDEFISIAEQTGLIHDLSIWVFQQSLPTIKTWIIKKPDFFLSINISATNLLERHFLEAMQDSLSTDTNLARHLILELTETQMMKDTQFALETLWHLNRLGVQIAIDDFGTGYSSLSYLRKLPAHKLKIDKSFILNLESDKQNQVLVQTAIDMAHNLGLKVVAEGVESEHTRRLLSEMSCDFCQGFHFSKPLPKDRFDKLLAHSK